MKHLLFFILFTKLSLGQHALNEQFDDSSLVKVETINFYAADSVLITADTYFLKDISPTVLLCHQAGYSRGEYIETAKKINALGFSCMAIDQRSGREVNNIINRTAQNAESKLMNVGHSGAKKDLEAAISYLYHINNNEPIIIVGSSYSASLALLLGTESEKIKAIAAFSPGEYLLGIDLARSLTALNKPTFVTSSKRESGPVEKLMRFVAPDTYTQFKPSFKGIHGSKALWKTTEGHTIYWNKFKEFLLKHK